MRILVAEDDQTSRLIIEAAVTSLGHECIVAKSGEEAWRLFETADVEVVISDRSMPGMDGIELCRLVRTSSKDTYTYFIFLTIFDERPDVISGMEAGADDYLIKPLDLGELKLRLHVASRVTALHRQLFRQAAELEQLNRQLFEQSRTDSLTGLLNRRAFFDCATDAGQAADAGRPLSAILFDIDHFKRVNDTYGHEMGDRVLAAVAAQANITDGAAGRLGGEEFCVLVPGADGDALDCAGNLQRSIRALRFNHAGQTFGVTCSFGIAEWEQGDAVDRMLRRADVAMYEAKKSGRDRIVASDTFALTSSHDEWRGAARVGSRQT